MSPYRLPLIASLLSLCFASPSLGQDLPPGEGREVVQSACLQCHGVDVIVAQRRSADEWKEVVARMIGNGASLDDNQYAAVVKYLGEQLGPQAAASPDKTAPSPAPKAR